MELTAGLDVDKGHMRISVTGSTATRDLTKYTDRTAPIAAFESTIVTAISGGDGQLMTADMKLPIAEMRRLLSQPTLPTSIATSPTAP